MSESDRRDGSSWYLLWPKDGRWILFMSFFIADGPQQLISCLHLAENSLRHFSKVRTLWRVWLVLILLLCN